MALLTVGSTKLKPLIKRLNLGMYQASLNSFIRAELKLVLGNDNSVVFMMNMLSIMIK